MEGRFDWPLGVSLGPQTTPDAREIRRRGGVGRVRGRGHAMWIVGDRCGVCAKCKQEGESVCESEIMEEESENGEMN